MKNIVIALLLSALIATPALADSTGKFYLAGDLGAARYSGVTVFWGTFPDSGMKRITGGYHISPMLAVELGYSRFGDSTLIAGPTTGTLSASSLQIAAIGSYPLSSEFDLIGKIGLANNRHKFEIVDIATASMSASRSALLFGFGAQFHINSQITLRTQYDNFGTFGNFGITGKPMKVSAFSLGVAYNF